MDVWQDFGNNGVKKLPRPTRAKKGFPDVGNLLSALSLKTIRLITSKSELSLDGKKLTSKVEINIGGNCGCNENEKTVLGSLSVTASVRGEDEVKPSILAQCEYQAVFDIPEHISPLGYGADEISKEMMSMVIHLLWPHIRSHIRYVTAEMSVKPITLPLFKPADLEKMTSQIQVEN